jgi:hypothetical protein
MSKYNPKNYYTNLEYNDLPLTDEKLTIKHSKFETKFKNHHNWLINIVDTKNKSLINIIDVYHSTLTGNCLIMLDGNLIHERKRQWIDSGFVFKGKLNDKKYFKVIISTSKLSFTYDVKIYNN